jgi:hypothetical protein
MDNNETFEILKLRKVTIKEHEINLANITVVEIYESITQPGIVGVINIRDYEGLQEIGNIFANDEIILSFAVDGSEENELTLKYKIYTNEGSIFLPHNTYDALQLGFCSSWLIDAFTRLVSKPYGKVDKEVTTSEIVVDLLKECGAEIGLVEKTKQSLENFVTPLWTPYHSIKYLLGFSTNEESNGGFLCWTDFKTDKVNVTSLDYLTKGSLGKYESFIVNPTNIRYQGRVMEMNIESCYDTVRMVNNGLPKTDIYAFDYNNSKFTITDIGINKTTQTRLANKFPLPTAFLEPKYTSSSFVPLFPQTAESNNTQTLKDFIEGHLNNKYSFLTTDAFKINISCLGETTRRAGWLTLLEYPSQDGKNTSNPDVTDNKLFKGMYLIREIKHVFSLYEDYKQYITLVSDGYKEFESDIIKWEK